MDWSFKELEDWDNKICDLAMKRGLDWFPITYEVCDYFSMIGHMSYHGMPTHYGHWSYGKTFEIEDEVKFVKRVEERILDIFTSRSNLTRNKIKRNWERKDWWISADESIELGLVDEVKAIMPEHMINDKKGKK